MRVESCRTNGRLRAAVKAVTLVGGLSLVSGGCALDKLSNGKDSIGDVHCSGGPESLVVVSLSSVGEGYLTNAVVDDLELLRASLEEMVRAAGGDIGDRLECEPIVVDVTYYMPAHEDSVTTREGDEEFPEIEEDAPEIFEAGVVHPDVSTFTAVNLRSGTMFDVTMPEVLRGAASRHGQRIGLHHGSRDEDPAYMEPAGAWDTRSQPPAAPHDLERAPGVNRGWSSNHDSRQRIGDVDVGATINPWRKISHLSNGCTGTMVGPRHLLTAAHCLFNSGTGVVSTPTIRPGRNGNSFLFGESALGGDVSEDAWVFLPKQWRTQASRIAQYDIAVVVLPDRLGDAAHGATTLGWMGWWYEGAAQPTSPLRFNRGYPSCDGKTGNGENRTDDPADPHAPPGTTSELTSCEPRHLYGDRFPCDYGEYHAKTSEGWYRNVKHSCDASAGHSGSPIYFYGNGEVGRPGYAYISGMDVQSLCGGWDGQVACSDDTLLQDRALRLTPEYAAMIHAVRLMFP